LVGSEPSLEGEKQTTIAKEVSASGIGLFTGEKVALKILPALPNTGIVFTRVDLPGKPQIPACLRFVREAPRCTRLATVDASVHMVEHLLSALKGMGVDNAQIEVEGPEILAADGSAKLFCDLLEQAEISIQDVDRRVLKISRPIFLFCGQKGRFISLPFHRMSFVSVIRCIIPNPPCFARSTTRSK